MFFAGDLSETCMIEMERTLFFLKVVHVSRDYATQTDLYSYIYGRLRPSPTGLALQKHANTINTGRESTFGDEWQDTKRHL